MRTIILGCDDGDNLDNYPIVAWAWNQLGWRTHLFYLGKDSTLLHVFKKTDKKFDTSINMIHRLPTIEGYSPDIVIQASKLFGGFCYWDDRILMTADIDIIPTGDNWPVFSEGRQVTADKAISRYLGMSASLWRMKMESGDKTTFDQELKLMLDANLDMKDKDPINRTIALNKLIMDRFIPKGMKLEDAKEPNHLKIDKIDNIKNTLQITFNKTPEWIK